MRALVYGGPWSLSVQNRPEPVPGPGEVLVDIIATGICGSDLHGYTGENGRRFPGQVMGHETVARVVASGPETEAPDAGTVVTVNPVIGCGHCPSCLAHATQRCPSKRVIGVTPTISSAFAERMVAPAGNVVPLARHVSADIGGLVEPLAVGYHAARQGGVSAAETVLVLGGGPIGQAAALAARRLGCPRVVVSDPDARRRQLVASLGFVAVDPRAANWPDAATCSLGVQASVVLDAVGTTQTLSDALRVSAPGSRVVLVGMNTPTVELDAYAISTQERTLMGSFCYGADEFRDTVTWAAAHASDLGSLVEGRVTLDDAPDAFHELATGALRASKVLVYPGKLPKPVTGTP